MSFNTNDNEERRNYEKVGRIYSAMRNHESHTNVIKNLLQTEGDINYRVLQGNSKVPNLLHDQSPDIALLLEHGADFTFKDSHGRTALHTIVQEAIDEKKLAYERKFVDSRVNSILDAHIKSDNSVNPRDENGISHFHAACMTNNALAVELFLKKGVDVDQAVNSDSPNFPLDTPLHFAVKYTCLDAVKILLKYGANVHLKNAAGLSPLQLIVERKISKYKVTMEPKFERMLNGFLEFVINNDDDDITDDFCKLHLASLIQDQCKVERILESVSNINQTVNSDSPICPGFTALHFAAYSKFEIFKYLLDKGAGIEAKDTSGVTPFDLCLQHYTISNIHSIVISKEEWKNIVLSDGKTKLADVISSMKSEGEFISLWNSLKSATTITVTSDSPLWPGYTLLHLSVVLTLKILDDKKYDKSLVFLCLKRGADVTVADAKGSTALHLAFYMQKYDIVEYLLDNHNSVANPMDKENLSHFHIACAAGHLKAVKPFLSNNVDANIAVFSTFEYYSFIKNRYFYICPGSTALHINMAQGDEEITKTLLRHGANIHAQDANGFTPIHRLLSAHIQYSSEEQFEVLLSVKNLKDTVTDSGLTHLHVACYLGHFEAVKKLLKHGANINASLTYKENVRVEDYDVYRLSDPYGELYKPVSFLSKYAGYTPLHFAWHKSNIKIGLLLMERGADVSMKNCWGICPMHMMMEIDSYHESCPFKEFKDNIIAQNYLEEKYGITKLHVACYLADVKLVTALINRGANVDAKVYSNSPIWKERSPLHCAIGKIIEECLFLPTWCLENANKLMYKINQAMQERSRMNLISRLTKIVQLLIDKGADILTKDDNHDTPFHLFKHFYCYKKNFVNAAAFVSVLFKNLRNYHVNPTNFQGLSIFHIACITGNMSAIDKYLDHNVDANQAISYFSDHCPGSTPLHLVMKHAEYFNYFSFTPGSSQEALEKIVDILLRNGANINATDAFGNTPLHYVSKLETKEMKEFFSRKLISNGADKDALNLNGDNPAGILLSNTHVLNIETFLKYGCAIGIYNSSTQDGYMSTWSIEKLIETGKIIEVDRRGRTFLHHVVSFTHPRFENYRALIEQFTSHGCDIDHEDNEGRTALHLATFLVNIPAILELLKRGADINITDKYGKTAFAYCHKNALENDHDLNRKIKIFAKHTNVLEFCGQHVNEQNKRLRDEMLKDLELGNNAFDSYQVEIESLKSVKIGTTSVSLYEFLMNTHMDIVYMSMTNDERRQVDEVLEKISEHKYCRTYSSLKFKYRQTIKRIKLLEPALESLNQLVKFQLPDLCCRMILKFLNNVNLKRLIAATI